MAINYTKVTWVNGAPPGLSVVLTGGIVYLIAHQGGSFGQRNRKRLY